MSQRRYGFVKPSLIRLFSLLDALGEALVPPARPPASPPQRIAYLNLAHLGDVLLTTPAVAALRQRYPASHLAMVVAPWGSAAIATNPRLDAVHTFAAPWWDRARGSPMLAPGAVLRLARLLRAEGYDTVIQGKSFFQENLAAALAGVPRRVGFGIYGGGFLQTVLVPFPWGSHTVLQHLALAAVLEARSEHPRLEFTIPPEEAARAAQLLAASGSEVLVAVHVGAGFPSKLWPLERYAALGKALIARAGVTVVLVGGAEDQPLAATVRQELRGSVLDLTGKLSWAGTAAVLQRAALFIGNDSGPAHLAAAVGTPALVIFSGQNEPAVWRPWGERVVVLQHRPACAPCGLRHCTRDLACLFGVSVEAALTAAEALLAGREGPRSATGSAHHPPGSPRQ
ncbi:MAG: glycosyl transferase [Dehalococcoidia bacterium]|nr:MAG: glycosyl transferase [Dehalococcoidia bacterium]